MSLSISIRTVNILTCRSRAERWPESDARIQVPVEEFDIVENGRVVATLHSPWLAAQALDDRRPAGQRWFENIRRI